ncbi:GNAT family N-acetyltransferase [Microbacterium sp. SD291]|uniref:GNAT family N-acetyltransferase n=1 Tax=Microbacterium sp. SD291 TaxID=2782007 RepID=UPI001A965621|nr:GNAT family N-acetyltransferase [Microbacterium sp. SD291]MBO0980543.1 GNAT family N-acetyltransferase [Microbacterium sp. SD291]
MTKIDARDVPADPTSAERLKSAGLEYRVVDLSHDEGATAFQRAVDRGFLGAEPTPEALAGARATFAARRNIAVVEPGAPAGALPVATTNSWVTPLTVPGGGDIPMWAISVVTVAATHRRRGIARSLLEGELRAAASAGVPIAGLTVSEATIYGRYGFGPAIPVAAFTVDTRRAGWAGPDTSGRLEYVDRETLAADIGAVHERARRGVSGRIPGWQGRWDGHSGAAPHAPDRDRVRGVRYIDEHGELRGALAYSLSEKEGTFRFSLSVRMLVAETRDALTALWRFALQHDLVDEVTADLRPLDDPLPWLVDDHRGVTKIEHDHGWLRILDLPAALTSRRYSAPLDLVLRVEDPLGFAAGDWRLSVSATGSASIEPVTGIPADVALDVSTLSALYAGGIRANALHGAGRIVADASAVEAIDRAFIAFPVPSLDIWY